MKYSEIAKMYCLSEKSVRRIVLNEKKENEAETSERTTGNDKIWY